MEGHNWAEVEHLFQQAVNLAVKERQYFLESACGGNDRLRDEVESLLAHDRRTLAEALPTDTEKNHPQQPNSSIDPELSSLLSVSVLQFADDELPAGSRLGAYEVRGFIAEGGMGTVYRAVRTTDFNKQVAIKVVKRGMDTKRILQRLEHERQILANLDHPNIAQLLDGGATNDGHPYLVMEYIEGRTLLHYCNSLSLRERLQLFCTICAAVQYAHQNLVVHRDLKPGNILVTADGIPKLLDFGIAKYTGS